MKSTLLTLFSFIISIAIVITAACAEVTTTGTTVTTTTLPPVMISGVIKDVLTTASLTDATYIAYNVNVNGSRGSLISSGVSDVSGNYSVTVPSTGFVEIEVTPSGSYPITSTFLTVPSYDSTLTLYTSQSLFVGTVTGGAIAVTFDGVTLLNATDSCTITGVNSNMDIIDGTTASGGVALITAGNFSLAPGDTTAVKKTNVPVGLSTVNLNGTMLNVEVKGGLTGADNPKRLSVVYFNL